MEWGVIGSSSRVRAGAREPFIFRAQMEAEVCDPPEADPLCKGTYLVERAACTLAASQSAIFLLAVSLEIAHKMASVSWPCRGSPPHIARPEPSKDSEPLGEHARERNGRASPAAAHRRSRSPSQQRVEGDPRQGGAEERGRKRTASGSPAPRQAGPRPQPAVEEAAAGGAARSVAGGGLQTAMQQDDGPPAHTSTPPAASSPAPNSLLSGGPEAEARAGGGGTGGTPLRAGSKSPVAHEATLLTLCPGSSPRSHPLPSATLDELAPFSPPPLPPAPRSLGPFVFGVFGAQGMRPYMEDRHAIVGSFVPRSSSGQEMRDGVPRSFAAVYDG